MDTYQADPIQADIDAIRSMLVHRILDARLIQRRITDIEVARAHEREVMAAIDRPALPAQIQALQLLGDELGIHLSMPPCMSYGQAVFEGVRLQSLCLRVTAQRTRRSWREVVLAARGGVA